jgi:predicted aspartyl protease
LRGERRSLCSPPVAEGVMRKFTITLASAVLALSVAAAARAGEKCHLTNIATLEMGRDASGLVTMPMGTDGKTLTMLVDTGGIDSTLTNGTVHALGLGRSSLAREAMVYGGKSIAYATTANNVTLGGLKAAHLPFVILPDGVLTKGNDGTIAPDILRAYDDDFDFGGNKLNLISPDHCEGMVVYWAKDYAQLDIKIDAGGHIIVPVSFNGKVRDFTFDTGSTDTLMAWETGKEIFDIDENSPGVTTIDFEGKTAYRYVVNTLTFGDDANGAVTIKNFRVTLVPRSVSQTNEMEGSVLGMDVLHRLHLYIAYREKHLFVTPSGAAQRAQGEAVPSPQ